MKKINILLAVFNIVCITFLMLQCQGSDPAPVQRGAEVLNCTNCTPLLSNGASADFNTSGVAKGIWYFDKVHSNVSWEALIPLGSLLTGRFNYFALSNFSMDEQNPSHISFEGFVRLNSVNTGEPLRDGGCLLTTFNTTNTNTIESTNLATIISTSVTARTQDDGYDFKANFTFNGVTRLVSGILTYTPQKHFDATGSATGYTTAGVQANFDILANTDYLINSTNIKDLATIKIAGLLRKND